MLKTNRPESLRCGHCGGPVQVRGYGAPDVCSYCHQPVWLSERLRAAYARLEEGSASALRSFVAQRRPGVDRGKRGADRGDTVAWLVGGTMLFALGACGIVMKNEPWNKGAEKVFTWLCALVCPAIILLYARREERKKAAALAASRDTASPASGADPLVSCEVDAPGKEANDAQLLRERMARFRDERADWYVGKTKVIQRPPGAVPVFLGFVLFATLFAAITQILPARGPRNRHFKTTGEGLVALAVWVGILGGGIHLRRRIAINAARWSAAAAALRAELGGSEAAPLDWLNSVWAGPVPRDIVRWGLYTQTIGCQLNGYPALFTSKSSGITLLLAAWTPGDSDAPDRQVASSDWRVLPDAAALVSELEASDFNVIVTPAGLIGSVCQSSMTDLRAHPERLVALAPAIRRIADLATAVRAQPVDVAWFAAQAPDADAPSSEGET